MPVADPLSIQHLEWASGAKDVPFISFDVKWVGILSTARKGLEFNWTFPAARNNASMYIFVIQNVYKHIALLPPAVLAGYSTSTNGTTAIIANVPPELSAFMVADIHLKLAIRSLFRARSLEVPYQNPTTGLRTKGWEVQTTIRPALVPSKSSGTAMTFEILWSLCILIISCSQYKVLQNRLAPMMGDFIIISPDGEEMLIEHKVVSFFGANNNGEWQLYREGRPGASPFAANRCWTHLIIQPPPTARGSLYCLIVISRDLVPAAWQHASVLCLQDLVDALPKSCFLKGPQLNSESVLAMLEFMSQKYTSATQAVTAILSTLPTAEIAKANKDDHDTYLDTIEDDHDEASLDRSQTEVLVTQGQYQRQIDVVAHALNRIGRSYGPGFCVILPPGHAYGDLLFLDHVWEQEEKQRYDDYRELPAQVYEHRMRDAIGIPIRTADMAAPGICPDPFQIRVFHYRKSSCDQPHVTIGLPIPANIVANLEILPRFLFYPSCLTRIFDPTNIKRNDFPKGHNGNHYFRTIILSDNILDLEDTSFTRSTPIRKGCEIMRNQDMDPLHLTRSCEDIYWHLRDMLKGDKECFFRHPVDHEQIDAIIDASQYLVSVQQVHTAGWDFGRKFSSVLLFLLLTLEK